MNKIGRIMVEWGYKSTNWVALSNDDDIRNRVNNAFLKGEWLEDITINGKTYKGLLFDENSQQSLKLRKNGTFNAYFTKYLSCIKEEIIKSDSTKEIDSKIITDTLKEKLKNPNFSKFEEIRKFDYYGLMGGTQNIDIDFEITSTADGDYNLKTTMYVNDWYGADSDDICKRMDYENIAITTAYAASHPVYTMNNKDSEIFRDNINSNLKSFIPGLQELFYLQHHYGCKPFATQIIYKSEDKIKIE